MNYKLCPSYPSGAACCSVWLLNQSNQPILCIPFDPANTDYQKFKVDVMEGAELQDADGNVMTSEEAIIFISNLPY